MSNDAPENSTIDSGGHTAWSTPKLREIDVLNDTKGAPGDPVGPENDSYTPS